MWLEGNAGPIYQQFDQLKNADAQTILAAVKGGRNPMREMAQQRRKEMREQAARDAKLRRRARPLLRELERARREGDQRKVAEIAARLEQMGVPLGERASKGNERDLLRAMPGMYKDALVLKLWRRYRLDAEQLVDEVRRLSRPASP